MAVVAPLAVHCLVKGLGLERILSEVSVHDATALAQGVCLCLVFALLLRLRRYKWRRIRPERIIQCRPPGSLDSPGTRSPRQSHADGSHAESGRPRTQTSALL